MTLHWGDLALMVAMAAAGWGVGYFVLLRKLRRAVAESQRETDRRLGVLTEAFMMQEPGLVENGQATDALAAEEIETELTGAEAESHVGQAEERIPEEIQVAIAAAAIALLGSNARVRSTRVAGARDRVSPWSQQGRVIVHSSHNLGARR